MAASPIAAARIATPAIVVSGDEDRVGRGEEARVVVAEAVQETRELVPVPQSVFDDEFFRSPRRPLAESEAGEPDFTDRRRPSARGFDSPDAERPLRVMYEDAGRTSAAEVPVAEPMVRVPVSSGIAAEPAHADELDIPAFLRRGQ